MNSIEKLSCYNIFIQLLNSLLIVAFIFEIYKYANSRCDHLKVNIINYVKKFLIIEVSYSVHKFHTNLLLQFMFLIL